MTIADRFWAKVHKTDGCWLWTGAKQHNGYGYLHRGTHSIRQPMRAHRFSWEVHFGEIPSGMDVCHRCDVPACVNPSHLFVGDRQTNMRDAATKGRITTIGQSRKTHCKRGHPFDAKNTRRDGRGHRRCIACSLCDSARYRDAIRSRGEGGGTHG